MKWLRTGLWWGMVLVCAANASADTWVPAGWVSGTWTAAGSPYIVSNGWVQVHPDSILIIEPGVTVFFDSSTGMEVRGRLTALGTEADSIRFEGVVTDSIETAWRGLVFVFSDSAADYSQVSYAVLERAFGKGLRYGTGGAIQCLGASPTFLHCSIRNNRAIRSAQTGTIASRHGGGVYLFESGAHFTDCEFTSNNPGPIGIGGAVFCENTDGAVFTNCVMHHDTAGSGGAVAIRGRLLAQNRNTNFVNCEISRNFAFFNGGAVHLDNDDIYPDGAYFDSCMISDNSSIQCGGGIFVHQARSPSFDFCEIKGNESFWGGGLYAEFSFGSQLYGCVFTENVAGAGGAMYLWQASSQVNRTTIVANTASLGNGGELYLNETSASFVYQTVVSHIGTGDAIFFNRSMGSSVHYCDITSTDGVPFGFYPDESAGPPELGELLRMNANGDSCDNYWNIYLDPQFVDAPNSDFHLNWNSPCIDAGNPNDYFDPDGTTPDIGAFYRDIAPADPERTAVRRYELMQNYPNPFNAVTRIEFDLPRAGEAELAVYDLSGRRVTTLLSGKLAQGHHDVSWDAAGLPSGVYIYRLRAGEMEKAKKMIILK